MRTFDTIRANTKLNPTTVRCPDVNSKNKFGGTPVLYAAEGGHREIVELLIADLLRKHGAKTGEELEAAEPVAEAAKPEPTGVNAPDNLIRKAVRDGNIEAVKQYLDAGTDVNAKDENGVTPLHQAAFYGQKEVVELLIAKGADVNAKEGDGWTPLHFAAEGGHNETAELLIAAGVDVNAKAESGETPLDWAIMNKQTELTALLRKQGGKTGEELKAEGK